MTATEDMKEGEDAEDKWRRGDLKGKAERWRKAMMSSSFRGYQSSDPESDASQQDLPHWITYYKMRERLERNQERQEDLVLEDLLEDLSDPTNRRGKKKNKRSAPHDHWNLRGHKKAWKVKRISSLSCGDIRTWKRKTKSSQGCDRGTDQEEGENYPIPKVSSLDVRLVVAVSNQWVS